MIQEGGEDLHREIHKVCNEIWANREIPEQWKKSILITIPIKGDLAECNNYRTIVLMSHMEKKYIMKVLTDFVSK